ncbi:MAG: sterol desaturase family protein [Alphaproteobacteria bacterium]|nr:sterol desaturase family protein [Alphaproteobacteria bacterium]
MSDLISYLLYPLYFVSNPHSQYYWPTYLAGALSALLICAMVKRRIPSANRALNTILPAKLLSHSSSKLDLKLMALGFYYLLAQGLAVSGLTWISVGSVGSTLTALFGESPAPIAPSYLVTGLSMVLVFLAVELGYWFSHLLMHKIPALWEFHKVHHSAEVLTPLTEWRQHPLELAIFPVLVGLAVVLVQGPIVWYFGESSQIISPISANLLSMAFWYTILHLRHSELPFYATGTLGKIIQAPAHHQVHHSTNPKHFDKNLGYCLSVWDWAFGTLYVPQKGEKFSYGLGHKDSALETVIGSMLAPFGRAAGLLIQKYQGAKLRNE